MPLAPPLTSPESDITAARRVLMSDSSLEMRRASVSRSDVALRLRLKDVTSWYEQPTTSAISAGDEYSPVSRRDLTWSLFNDLLTSPVYQNAPGASENNSPNPANNYCAGFCHMLRSYTDIPRLYKDAEKQTGERNK